MKFWNVMLLVVPLMGLGCKKKTDIESLDEPEDVDGPGMPTPGGDEGPDDPNPPLPQP